MGDKGRLELEGGWGDICSHSCDDGGDKCQERASVYHDVQFTRGRGVL